MCTLNLIDLTCELAGVCGCYRTRSSMTSHKCSIGDMSGELGGHGNTLSLLASRTFCTILAVLGLALS